MAKRLIEESTLSAIGDMIRRKTGRTGLLTPEDGMIDALSTLDDNAEQVCEEIDMSTKTWTRGLLEPNSKKIVGASSYGVYTISFSDLYAITGAESSIEFVAPAGCIMRISIVSNNTGVSDDGLYVKWTRSGVFNVSDCAHHTVCLSVKYEDERDLSDSDANALAESIVVKVVTGNSELVADKPETIGQLACLSRIKQMRDIQYAPVAELPYNNGTYAAGTVITGLPYSSVRKTDKFIGYNVSLHTFMTALQNPNSVLYTKSSSESHAKTWYGTNCSTFVSYAYGSPYHNATAIFASMDFIEPIEVNDMKLCDAANMIEDDAKGGHVVIISGIIRDKAGNIVTVEISESDGVGVSKTTMPYDAFLYQYIELQGYKMYRNTDLYKASYEPSEFVRVFDDEPVVEHIYSCLSTNLGDKATIGTDEAIILHPLKTDGYSAIKLYRDGEEIGSYDVSNIELNNLPSGKYLAKLYPESEKSETSFIVCSASVAQNEKRYTFSGECGSPIRVLFKNSTGFTLYAYDLTDEDISRGYVDLDYSDSEAATVCVPFKNEYGFVVAQCNYTIPTNDGAGDDGSGSGGDDTGDGDDQTPSDSIDNYTQVDYIETDGGQYIDTGVLASDYAGGITYGMSANVSQVLSTDNHNWFFGALSDGKRSGNLTYWGGGNFRLYAGGSDVLLQHSIDIAGIDIDIEVSANSNSPAEAAGAVNNNSMTRQNDGTATTMPEANIYLLRCNGASSGSWFCGKLYSFTMNAADGSAIRNFVPVYRNTDNVIGLYDTVENKFYENAGSGSFAIDSSDESNVMDGYQQVNYIQADGNQYIDTGVLASAYPDGIKYTMSSCITELLAKSGNNWMFGALKDSKRSGNLTFWGSSTSSGDGNFRLFAGGDATLLQHTIFITGVDTNIEIFASSVTPESASGIINGVEMARQNAGSATEMPDANIYLMRCNGASSGSYFCGKLYSFDMETADGTPIRKFIPVYRTEDNIAGLYDTVENKFYENAGTGSFVIGEAE